MGHSEAPYLGTPAQTSAALENLLNEEFDPSNLQRLLRMVEGVQLILSRYTIDNSAENPDSPLPAQPMGSLDNVIEHITTHSLPLTSEGVKALHAIQESLLTIIDIHRCVSKYHSELACKLNTAFDDQRNIWDSLSDWINQSTTQFLNHSGIHYSNFVVATQEWLTDTNRALHRQLESSMKDHVHALVNKEIILPHQKKRQALQADLVSKPIKDNPVIRAMEDQIQSKLDQIMAPFNAPFMAAFSKELFTRCYRRLLSPMPPPTPAGTIREITSEQVNLPELEPLPAHIQHKFDMEYCDFLKEMVNKKPDVRAYVRSRFKAWPLLSNHNPPHGASAMGRSYIHLYKMARRYESLVHALGKIQDLPQNPNEVIGRLCQNIEQIGHAYSPFLRAYIQQLQVVLQIPDHRHRKAHLTQYASANQALLAHNKKMSHVRLINHSLQRRSVNPKGADLPAINAVMADSQGALIRSVSPWMSVDWAPLFNEIINACSLRLPTAQGERRVIRRFKASPSPRLSVKLHEGPPLSTQPPTGQDSTV